MAGRPWNRKRSSERGTALIEFALVLPLLLVLTLAALDLGRAFLAKNVLHQAAREGVRMRVVMLEPVSSGDIDLVEARARQVAASGGFRPADVGVTVSAHSSPSTRQDSVSVTAPFTFTFPLLFRVVGMDLTNPMPLTATCYMKQE